MFCHQTESTIRTDERKHQKSFTRKFFPDENGWPPVRAHLTETEVRETRVYIIYTLVGRMSDRGKKGSQMESDNWENIELLNSEGKARDDFDQMIFKVMIIDSLILYSQSIENALSFQNRRL